MNLTDGYYIDPFIIWREMDHRGYVAAGFELSLYGNEIEKLKALPGKKQIIIRNGKMLVFLSTQLSELCPKQSTFNLSEKQLQNFYRSTLEKVEEYFLNIKGSLEILVGQSISFLRDVEHFGYLVDFFHLNDKKIVLDPTKPIYKNLFDSYKTDKSVCGFKMAGIYHNVLLVDRYSKNYPEIFSSLRDYHLTITMGYSGSQIIVAGEAEEESEILNISSKIRDSILKINDASYYEPNDKKESFRFFESCIPGWMYGANQQVAEVFQ